MSAEAPDVTYLFELYRRAVDARAWRTNIPLWREVKLKIHGWSEEAFQEIADYYDKKDRDAAITEAAKCV